MLNRSTVGVNREMNGLTAYAKTAAADNTPFWIEGSAGSGFESSFDGIGSLLVKVVI